MSWFVAGPEAIAAAASDLARIGSTIGESNTATAQQTAAIPASAADGVSAAVASFWNAHAQGYQDISAQMSAFHEKFVQALGSSAASYAGAESSAARALADAVNAPAQQLLGHPLVGPAAPNLAAAAARAATQVQGALQSVPAGNLLGVLGLTPTGGLAGLTATRALAGPLAAAAAPAAVIPVSWATAIENFYNVVEPYVQYGFNLAAYAAGWLPYVGILAPQINFLYNLFEPMVQAGLFNTLDWLSGTISFSQGLSNFLSATSASINQFLYTEWYWFWSFLPPLPPLPPFLP